MFLILDLYSLIVKISKPYKEEQMGKVWLGPFLFFVPLNPDDIKIALQCDYKPTMYEEVIDYGLLMLNGDTFKLHRKAVYPIFSAKSLQNFLPATNQIANEILDNFEVKTKAFNLIHLTMDFSIASSLINFFGAKHVDKEQRKKFLEATDA